MSRFHPPGECPVCGAEVARGARACPECGASEADGWGDDTDADGLELPETNEERERREQSEAKEPPSQAFNLAVVLLVVLVLSGLWWLF